MAALQKPFILVIEDNKADIFLIREALGNANIDAELHVVTDGEQALNFFNGVQSNPSAQRPDLVLLDINVPRYKGGTILRHLRGISCCAATKVLAVTSSDSKEDREEMEALGIDSYFCKPSEFKGFMELGGLVRKLLA